jgi:hypothetical protein
MLPTKEAANKNTQESLSSRRQSEQDMQGHRTCRHENPHRQRFEQFPKAKEQ